MTGETALERQKDLSNIQMFSGSSTKYYSVCAKVLMNPEDMNV